MRTLEGKTALVTGGGKGIGRAIALALSARGVRVVVTGRQERALGETVGEIAHGGGKARHLAGDVRDPAHLAAAVGRAVDVFGGLDLVIANAWEPGSPSTNIEGADGTFKAAIAQMAGPGRLVIVSRGEPGAALAALVARRQADLEDRKITCDCVVVGAGEAEEVVGQRVVALCGEWAASS